MGRQRGLTLMEALVVLTIIGILAAFGFPAMTRFLQAQAIRSASYDLHADLIFARSEAISRGESVSIIGNATTDFKQGWIIRENRNGQVIRTQAARDSAINFTSTASTITFDRSGRTDAGLVSFNIVPSDGSSQDNMKRCIRLDPQGRPRTAEGACP